MTQEIFNLDKKETRFRGFLNLIYAAAGNNFSTLGFSPFSANQAS